jgi:hypothetical protein
MGKTNTRLEAARLAYRDALDSARARPTQEAWARLLAAGKDLSALTEPRSTRSGRRSRKDVVPTIQELEGPVEPAARQEVEMEMEMD